MFKQITKEELKVTAHVDYLADLREFVMRIGRKYHFSEKVINAFKLAIDEAGTNIIRHAYREFKGEPVIIIRALVRENSLTICLIDQGKYFDPKRVQDPDLQRYVQIGKKGGLGIFIIRKLMDEIDYRKTEEGNELRLTKLRDSAIKRSLTAPLQSAVKAIPSSLKAKYGLRTSLVLILVVASGYGYYFFKTGNDERQTFFTTLRETDVQINQIFEVKPDLLNDVLGVDVSAALQRFHDGRRDLLYEVALVDSLDYIVGHNNQNYLLQKFTPPPADKQRIDDKTSLYELAIDTASGSRTRAEIFDVVTTLQTPGEFPEKRQLHVRAYKSYLDNRIAAARWAYGRLAVTVALLGSAGAFALAYILMTPMRKLADWVRLADHGEIGDEMDIDSSTEIGEIAQAFSEITNKFRESQKNLADQERLQKEMQVAQEIQQTLLPSDFPDLEGYELASHYEAAREVGGDYYDFVEVDKDTLGVVVADVSGKGVPGSLVMTMIRQALRTEARGVKDAAEVLAKVNKAVMGDVRKGMFVTLFYVIIDSKRRRLNYASAGHNPMILYRPTTKKTYYLNPRGFPVGIQLPDEDLFRKSIESDTIQLTEDDILLIYTDGITEAMNARRELFGEERLLKIIREQGHLRVKPFVEKIKDEILSFTAGEEQSDDITLVTVKEKTSPEKEELRRAKEAHKLIVEGKSIREACEIVGITTYAYYNKYKKEFEEKGLENIEVEADISVEAKHIAIEDKVKILDIIRKHPEYGAKRINEELNGEAYEFTVIPENKIYDELVRSRLNTRQLRESFVARGDRHKRPMKTPGTPMLTLSGEVILDRSRLLEAYTKPARDAGESHPPKAEKKESQPAPEGVKPVFREVALDPGVRKPLEPAKPEPMATETGAFFASIEELLGSEQPGDVSATEISAGDGDEAGRGGNEIPALKTESPETPPDLQPQETGTTGISFEDLFAGGTMLEELTRQERNSSKEFEGETQPPVAEEASTANGELKAPPAASHSAPEEPGADYDFAAVDDLLKNEIEFSFGPDEAELQKTSTDSTALPPIDVKEEDAGSSSMGGELALPFVEVSELLEYASDESVAVKISPAATGEITATGAGTSSARETMPGQDAVSATVTRENGRTASAHVESHTRTSGIPGAGGNNVPNEDEREQLLIEGLRHYKSQRFKEAIDEFQKAIALFPNFKEAHSILGNAYFRNRMYDEAAIAYQRVKELDASDTTAYENMGVIFANRGDYRQAMKEWQRVLEIDPGRDDIRRKIELAARMMMKRTAPQA